MSGKAKAKTRTVGELFEWSDRICRDCKMKEIVGCDKADCIVNMRKFVSEAYALGLVAENKELKEQSSDEFNKFVNETCKVKALESRLLAIQQHYEKFPKSVWWEKKFEQDARWFEELGVLLKEGDKK